MGGLAGMLGGWLPQVAALCSPSAAFHQLYPQDEFAMRNAASRTDGYWPFIAQKEEPPAGLTYGEFPLDFFSRVVDRACELGEIERSEAVLCDVVSGAGRLVLWAASSTKWRAVHGVELLPSLHAAAVEKRDAALELHARGALPLRTPLESVSLHAGSYEDGALLRWAEVDVCFVYATAFAHDGNYTLCEESGEQQPATLTELSDALNLRLRAGCLVCTSDYTLGEGFEVVEQMAGTNEGVGGTSVVYLHRKQAPGEAWAEAARRKIGEIGISIAERDDEIGVLEARLAEMRAENEAAREEVAGLRAQLEEEEGEEEEALDDLMAWASAAGYDLS